MSLGDESASASRRATTTAAQARLRAVAHPVRLRIMSLLTGAALTAADVARELGLSHANVSYHLRRLLAAELIVPAGEEKIRGGVAKRYRYDPAREDPLHQVDPSQGLFRAFADELIRRGSQGRWEAPPVLGDVEVWLAPDRWDVLRRRMVDAVRELHDLAQPPRSPGTVRISATVAVFEMESGPGSESGSGSGSGSGFERRPG